MKKICYRHRQDTVDRIMRIIKNHKDIQEIHIILYKKLKCNSEQTEFILRYKLTDLISELGDYTAFFNGIKELENKK